MLGKDYMLAIILVNCDGVHGGTRWEGGLQIEREEGARRATPRLKDREEGVSWGENQGTNEP